MSHASLPAVLPCLYRLAAGPSGPPDRELLQRWSEARDEAAFAELVRRHGPLVWGACRRLLRREQDAEDAFQAAFVVLARKAGAVAWRDSVGGWLHDVACRLARDANRKAARRRECEARAALPAGAATPQPQGREMAAALDEELRHLPETYRAPLLLCCLGGTSGAGAARQLGLSLRTLRRRLQRGRELLRAGLDRRGLAVPAAAAFAGTASAVPPAFPAGRNVSEAALALAEGLLRGMAVARLGPVAVLVLGLLAAIAGAVAFQAPAQPPGQTPPAAATRPVEGKPSARTDRFGDPLPAGALARLGTTRFRHGFMMYGLAVSPDGRMLATAGGGRGVCLWDLASGKEVHSFPQLGNQHFAVAFSPDSKLLAAGSGDGAGTALTLFDPATGKEVRTAEGPAAGALSIAFSPDGKEVAWAERGGTVRLAEVDSGKEVRSFKGHQGDVHGVAFSPDGRLLASAGEDGSVRLWEVATGKESARHTEHKDKAYAVAFSPDGKLLASGGGDGRVRLWDVATRKSVLVLAVPQPPVRGVAFSPDGRLVAAGDGQGTIVLWDVAAGREVRRWRGHAFGVAALAFSPDGKTLVSAAYWESCPRLWDPATGQAKGPDAGHHSAVEFVAFAADGKALLTTGRDQRLLGWDPATGRATLRFDTLAAAPDASAHDTLLRSPDGRTAATWGHKDETVRLWDVATGKERRALGEVPGKSQASFRVPFAFSPDGRWLAACGKDGNVQVWGMADYERHPFEIPGSQAHALALSHDGGVLALSKGGQVNPIVYLWDLKKDKELLTFNPGDMTDALTFSPGGRLLATANGYNGTVRIWDTATGRELRPLQGGPTGGWDLAFSPDGRLLAAAGGDKDKKVHLWEVATGLKAREYEGHVTGVMSVAFSPDGRMLASGGGDSLALVWDLTGKEARPASLTAALLEKRWTDLASDDGGRGLQAVWDLAADPAAAVPFLKARLRPAEAVPAERVAGLIRDLGSEDFGTRDKATQELEKLIDAAEPALRRALEKDPTAEVRKRLEGILEKREPMAVPGRLRQLRAVQALGYAATPEAVELLKTLATGAPTALQTREAKAALGRLPRRPATSP